jgi:putative urate catabolism protein
MSTSYPRDLVGYGETPPNPRWPNRAKIALQFVINYEEGGENCVLHGDGESERFLSEIVGAESYPDRHLSMESIYEYGSRAGFWRLHRLFNQEQIPVTVFGVATALEKNPDAVKAMVDSQWEIASHGLRWIHYQHFTKDQERTHIEQAIAIHQHVTGSKPSGWYTGRTSPHTLELIAERDDILYCADSYADDLPYMDKNYSKPLLMVPYTLDTNDMRFATPQGFNSGEQFYQYLKDAFDELYNEGETSPKMLSIGLHCRIIGRPARFAALRRFVEYTKQFDRVWYATREQIARHWLSEMEEVEFKGYSVSDSTTARVTSEEKNSQTHNVCDISAANLPEGTARGDSLSGLRLSVKDLFAIAGFKTGAGLPQWLSTATVESENAEAVSILLDNGALLTHKTQLDELAYSLAGNNSHYGFSANPIDDRRTSGGSSSGAAVSVALNESDLALATDTGGSIRVPASYCGLYGMRPTQGAVTAAGLIPLAPRFDTPGLISQTLDNLELGYRALLSQMQVETINSLAWCEALWDGVNEQLRAHAWQIFQQFEGHTTRLDSPPLTAQERRFCFSVLQADSIWQTHGAWLASNINQFGEDIQQRLNWGKALSDEDKAKAHAFLREWNENKSKWMPDGCVLLMPTVPDIAPLNSSSGEQMDIERQVLLGLTSIAGLSGWPQLQIPAIRIEGMPIGISLLGKTDMDLSVIQLGQRLTQSVLNLQKH